MLIYSFCSDRHEFGEPLPNEQRPHHTSEIPQQQPHPFRSTSHERLRGRIFCSGILEQFPKLSSFAPKSQETPTQYPLRSSRAHGKQTPLLLFVSDFHGHRGFGAEGVTSERDIRLDFGSFSLLQERTNGLEKQRAA